MYMMMRFGVQRKWERGTLARAVHCRRRCVRELMNLLDAVVSVQVVYTAVVERKLLEKLHM